MRLIGRGQEKYARERKVNGEETAGRYLEEDRHRKDSFETKILERAGKIKIRHKMGKRIIFGSRTFQM